MVIHISRALDSNCSQHCLLLQNMLTAVMYPHGRTGYKDPKEPCNRTDKRNGGEFRRFERYGSCAMERYGSCATARWLCHGTICQLCHGTPRSS